MLLDSTEGCTIRPLHRAAFTGSAEVLCVLIDEMPNALPNGMKSKILDCRTELDYTPYMLACKCGHVEVAQMLVEKGCNVALMNSSQRTGKKLADVFQREFELSCVHPWSRADRQHLVATSLESFLDMTKAALNEHVCAGMKVWNSKQMVWKFSKEQIQALQTRIKQLVWEDVRMHVHTHGFACTRSIDRAHAKQAEKGTDALACTHARAHVHSHAHAILHARSITCKHAHMQAQAEKGSDIALHFTDIRSCMPAHLEQHGDKSIFSRTIGRRCQCMLAHRRWLRLGQRLMAIGKALWGSKWYKSHAPHARTHARTHVRTHARTHARMQKSQV